MKAVRCAMKEGRSTTAHGHWWWVAGVCLFVAVDRQAVAGAREYGDAVRAAAPVSYWPFEDASSINGATVADAMSVNPGTYNNGVTLATGIAGNAATFGGTAYLDIPDSASLALNTLSVEFWFKSTEVWNATYWPGSATLLSKGTTGPNSSDWSVLGGSSAAGVNNGQVIGTTGPSGVGGDKTTASANGLNDGEWHHVVWMRSSAGVQSLYVDGRFQATATDNAGAIVNTRPLQLGGDPFLGGAYLDGEMDEVAIYDRILSDVEITRHWALLRNTIDAGVAGGLRVDSGLTGQVAQPGYAAWTGLGAPNSPVAAVFTNCLLGVDRQNVSVLIAVSGLNPGGSTTGGFYNNSGTSGSYADLFNDYYFGRKTVTLTLSGLRGADYVLKTYHHEKGATANVLLNLSLQCGESAVSDNGVIQTYGTLPAGTSGQGGGVSGAATLPFTADGVSETTLTMVRQTTGPWDNVALNGFELHKLGVLRVDIGRVATPTQADFTSWHFDAADANPHSTTFTDVNLRKGPDTFTVTLEPQGVNLYGAAVGGTASNTQTGSGGPMDNLATGAYFARRDLVMTLSGLLPAMYNLVTFHRGQTGILDTTLTDADGTQIGQVPQTGSSSTPGDMGIGDFTFRSDGVNPVVLRLHTPNVTGLPDNAYLNGFTLVTTPTQGTLVVIR